MARQPDPHRDADRPAPPDARGDITATGVAHDWALLATKLFVPRPRPDLVPRPRLYAALDAGMRRKLTLLAAPAGSGKTTLLAAWRATPAGAAIPLAWVALDRGDNDPARCWRHIGAAIETLCPGAGQDLALLLGAAPAPAIEVALTGLINALAHLEHDVALVLDDYHVIENPAIHDGLNFLLDHLPPPLHLILTSRVDPPLPLSRLRARGELVELRAADLRFTLGEVAAFLDGSGGPTLGEDEVATLAQRTEGWVAGLQLAALSLRDHADPRAFVAAFAGSDRFVLDYLAEETLGQQSEAAQTFLLQTSLLDRFTAPLCDAVTGGRDGAQRLKWLEEANLFLVPLDNERRWYRYHHLFADVLRGRLVGTATPEEIAALHRRASVWLAEQGLGEEAVRHALAAGDTEQAASLIARHGLAVAVDGRVHTAVAWLDALPPSLVRDRAELGVLHAALLLMSGEPAAARERLGDAERAAAAEPPGRARQLLGQVALFRATLERVRGDLVGAFALLREANELLAEAEPFWIATAKAQAARSHLVTGDVTASAEAAVAALIAPARASGNPFAYLAAIASLARLQAMQGRLRAAAATYREALEIVPDPRILRELHGSMLHHIGLGDILREWGDLEAAEEHLRQGLALARRSRVTEAETAWLGSLALARLEEARGDRAAALAALADFLDLARERACAPALTAVAQAERARLLLAGGDPAAAMAWAAASRLRHDDEPHFPREREYLILARIRIAQSRRDGGGPLLQDALALLDRWLAYAEAGGRGHSAIAILILQALAWYARGDLDRALAALDQALLRAEPEGYVRLFADEGIPLGALLTRVLDARRQRLQPSAAGASPTYLQALLAAMTGQEAPQAGPTRAGGLVEPLTPREREVLRLIAAGLANPDIAERLFVTVGTVKWYVNTIFGKLAVTSRTQAVARARDLHLLDD